MIAFCNYIFIIIIYTDTTLKCEQNKKLYYIFKHFPYIFVQIKTFIAGHTRPAVLCLRPLSYTVANTIPRRIENERSCVPPRAKLPECSLIIRGVSYAFACRTLYYIHLHHYNSYDIIISSLTRRGRAPLIRD